MRNNLLGGLHPLTVWDNMERTTAHATFGPKTKRKPWRLLLFVGTCLACAVIVLAIGPNEAELEQRTYCQNVERGVWPDYEGTFAAECKGVVTRPLHANLRK